MIAYERAVNRPRQSVVGYALEQLSTSTLRAEIEIGVVNAVQYRAGTYEDLSSTWTDFSFDWAAEDFPPGLTQ